jgi:hypothetical protein
MVSATVALTRLITNTPKKLKTAAIRIASLGGRQRVTTQVAIALGASVQPFTRITPSVSATAIKRSGFSIICSKKYEKDKSMAKPPKKYVIFI